MERILITIDGNQIRLNRRWIILQWIKRALLFLTEVHIHPCFPLFTLFSSLFPFFYSSRTSHPDLEFQTGFPVVLFTVHNVLKKDLHQMLKNRFQTFHRWMSLCRTFDILVNVIFIIWQRILYVRPQCLPPRFLPCKVSYKKIIGILSVKCSTKSEGLMASNFHTGLGFLALCSLIWDVLSTGVWLRVCTYWRLLSHPLGRMSHLPMIKPVWLKQIGQEAGRVQYILIWFRDILRRGTSWWVTL